MKKLLCLGVALTMLSACSSYDPDLDAAAEKRAENRAEVRAEIGCQFANDHEAYRRCLLSTYKNNKPKTFTTSQDCKGQPVAVVSSGAVVSNNTGSGNGVNGNGTVSGVASVACTADSVTPCLYQTQDVYEMTMPCPTCQVQPQQQFVVEQPQVIEQKETVVEKPLEVVPMPQPLPEKTWWETYQEEQKPAEPKVVCPCPDPNDPCPQCVTK